MSVRGVKNTIQRVTQDQTLDAADAKQVLDEAGGSVSGGEERALREALAQGGFEITPEARQLLGSTLGDFAQLRDYAERKNDMVARRAEVLEVEEKGRLAPGVTTRSLGGSLIPEAVKELLRTALEHGAVAYDPSELDDDPAKDDHGDGYTLAGKWTPYPQDLDAVGNLSFDYTEITPEKVKADMETDQTFNVITGFKTETVIDRRTGESRSFQVAEYEEVTRKGNGNITATYDEASHTDTYARGRDGQKYANNFAILSDGSLHCVPYARRNQANPGLILTNPSLGRGQRMLFNGHIEMRAGVITSVGMSGRIHKLAAEGDAKFVNPIPLLKAWGFEVSPNVTLRFEGSSDKPPVDPDTHVIG